MNDMSVRIMEGDVFSEASRRGPPALTTPSQRTAPLLSTRSLGQKQCTHTLCYVLSWQHDMRERGYK